MLHTCEMGLLHFLLRHHLHLCLFHLTGHKLHALLARRKRGLHWLHSLRRILRWGHMGHGNLLRSPIRKTFGQIFPARFHQTRRQFLRIYSTSRFVYVPHIFFLHDELLDDRNLPTDDSRCQWLLFDHSQSLPGLQKHLQTLPSTSVCRYGRDLDILQDLYAILLRSIYGCEELVLCGLPPWDLWAIFYVGDVLTISFNGHNDCSSGSPSNLLDLSHYHLFYRGQRFLKNCQAHLRLINTNYEHCFV